MAQDERQREMARIVIFFAGTGASCCGIAALAFFEPRILPDEKLAFF
jgi:hypothetical protein